MTGVRVSCAEARASTPTSRRVASTSRRSIAACRGSSTSGFAVATPDSLEVERVLRAILRDARIDDRDELLPSLFQIGEHFVRKKRNARPFFAHGHALLFWRELTQAGDEALGE